MDEETLVATLARLFKADHVFEWQGAQLRVYCGVRTVRLVWVGDRQPRVCVVYLDSTRRVVPQDWMEPAFVDCLNALLA